MQTQSNSRQLPPFPVEQARINNAKANTVPLIAEKHGELAKNITRTFQRNKTHFVEGTDYFYVSRDQFQGELDSLRDLKPLLTSSAQRLGVDPDEAKAVKAITKRFDLTCCKLVTALCSKTQQGFVQFCKRQDLQDPKDFFHTVKEKMGNEQTPTSLKSRTRAVDLRKLLHFGTSLYELQIHDQS